MTTRPYIDWRRIDTRDLVDELDQLMSNGPGQDIEDIERRKAIKSLLKEIDGYAEDSFTDGIFLIADTEFEDYARELADDIGAVKGDGSWPAYCIDWAYAARELQQDYTTVEFEGITYWYR